MALSVGMMLSCGKGEPAAPAPKPPARTAYEPPASRADASAEKQGPRMVTRTIRAGDYLLYPNVLLNGSGADLDVFRVLEDGVELMMRGDLSTGGPQRVLFIGYGEKREAATFILDADLEIRKGSQSGTAALVLTYHEGQDKVFFRRMSKTFAKGEHVFQDRCLFSRGARSSLKVARANLWGVELAWDPETDKPPPSVWIKYGKSRTFGELLLTVKISASYGGTPGTASLEVLYPVLECR